MVCILVVNIIAVDREPVVQRPWKLKVGVKERALMANAGTRAYNGGLGAEPPAGPLVRGLGGKAPLKEAEKPFAFRHPL